MVRSSPSAGAAGWCRATTPSSRGGEGGRWSGGPGSAACRDARRVTGRVVGADPVGELLHEPVVERGVGDGVDVVEREEPRVVDGAAAQVVELGEDAVVRAA